MKFTEKKKLIALQFNKTGGNTMKKLSLLLLVTCFFLLNGQAAAQENFTEGAVWRVTLVNIKPGKGADFWRDLRQNLKPTWEEMKKQGVILDYTVNIKSTTDEPGDWNVALAFQYKNFAALDGLGAKTDPITLKVFGTAEARREAAVKRIEYGSTVASFMMRQSRQRICRAEAVHRLWRL